MILATCIATETLEFGHGTRTGWTGLTGRCWMMCCVTADTSSRRTQCRLLVACSVTLDGDGCSCRALASTASRACMQFVLLTAQSSISCEGLQL